MHPLPKPERLNEEVFTSLTEARTVIERWRRDYNTTRSHSALGGLRPTEARDQAAIGRLCDLLSQAPIGEEIAAAYDAASEFILPRDAWPVLRPQLP